jgi:pimeloyl-ACP methyl ester carboxylesterase
LTDDFDLHLPSGRLRARRHGPDDAPLLLCVHGLSANLTAFDWLGERLASPERQVVAIDLRGRGRSEETGPGTYGPRSHAQDVLDAATALGAETFDIAGWSLGGMIGQHAAAAAPGRVRSLALLDIAGSADPAAADAVRAGLARLDAVVDRPELYVAAIRAAGNIEPWSPLWDAYYRYELEQRDDGRWAPSTSRAAAEEDLARSGETDWQSLWGALTMPVTLVRALAPLGGGHVVSERTRDAFLQAVPHAALTETGSSHFTVVADESTLRAIEDLLASETA